MSSASEIVNRLLEAEPDARVDKVMAALAKGPIRAIGGIVYDSEMKPLISTTDLASVRHLIPFERTDAGGSPTWSLKSR